MQSRIIHFRWYKESSELLSIAITKYCCRQPCKANYNYVTGVDNQICKTAVVEIVLLQVAKTC